MVIYNVTGKKFVNEKELTRLSSIADYSHIRRDDESGIGRLIEPADIVKAPWIDLALSFWDEQQALNFARTNVENGLDGSYATVKKNTVKKRPDAKGYFPKEHSVICDLKKEHGEVVGFCKTS